MKTIYSFIGNFMIPSGVTPVNRIEQLAINGNGVFYMFADSVEKVGKIEKIAGRIMDIHGNATFVGEIEEDKIKFTKKYDERKNGHKTPLPQEVRYEAVRSHPRKFVGRYKLIERERIGEECNFVLIDSPTLFLELKHLFNC